MCLAGGFLTNVESKYIQKCFLETTGGYFYYHAAKCVLCLGSRVLCFALYNFSSDRSSDLVENCVRGLRLRISDAVDKDSNRASHLDVVSFVSLLRRWFCRRVCIYRFLPHLTRAARSETGDFFYLQPWEIASSIICHALHRPQSESRGFCCGSSSTVVGRCVLWAGT